MVIRTLTADDFELVHRAFLEAFSDYVIPIAPTREQLRELLTRRGWVPELSVAAFHNDGMVAFTLNAVEGDRAYDSGTGVVPTHRRHGLGRAMMERSFDVLRAHGARSYVLEVIDANEKAVALYRSLGFVETRGLQCWRYEARGAAPASGAGMSAAEAAAAPRDVEPSWQNTHASIARAKDPHLLLTDAHGYAIVFPSTGDLPQLFVKRSARRRGTGTRLLDAAASAAGKPLRILNVDDSDRGIAAFLEHAGAQRTVRQLEMLRPL